MESKYGLALVSYYMWAELFYKFLDDGYFVEKSVYFHQEESGASPVSFLLILDRAVCLQRFIYIIFFSET